MLCKYDLEPVSIEELRAFFGEWREEQWGKLISPVQEAINEGIGNLLKPFLYKPITAHLLHEVNYVLENFKLTFDHPDIRIVECQAEITQQNSLNVKLNLETISYKLGTLGKLNPILKQEIKDGIAKRFAQQENTTLGDTKWNRGIGKSLLGRNDRLGSRVFSGI